MNNNTTNALSEALSTKTKHLIIATKGDQHIKVEPNHLYEINIKEGEVLTSDINLIAKKVGNDLEVLLENNATVIFDNYFEVCTTDLSCLVSLPSKEGLYYVVDDTVTTLADGSQIVHSYGDAQALSGIAEGQSGLFETSFNDVFLAGEISALALAPLLALGGSGGGDSSSGGGNPSANLSPPIYGTNLDDVPLRGTSDNDDIYGLGGNDDIYGLRGNDNLYGGEGNDIIDGGEGNDNLYGGEGDDDLYGDAGDDVLEGGDGKDTFIYMDVGDGDDVIVDFQVGDTSTSTNINADVLDLAALLSYNQGDVINDFISFNDDGTNTILYIDADGDGSGFTDVSIELLGVTGVTLQDMIDDGNIVLF